MKWDVGECQRCHERCVCHTEDTFLAEFSEADRNDMHHAKLPANGK
jgi:hypothetical protein